MGSTSRFAMRAVLVLAISGAATGQETQLVLPGETGHLVPGPEWTVLGAREMAVEERATDPVVEPARSHLLGIIESLRSVPQECVLLHSAGPAGQLRLVQAYRVPIASTADSLASDALTTVFREMVEKVLANSGVTARYAGSERTVLCAVGGVRLRFDLRRDEHRWMADIHLLPAGQSTQWFVAMHYPDDVGAVPAIEGLVRTFSGARNGVLPTVADRFAFAKNSVLIGGSAVLASVLILGLRRNAKPERTPRRRRRVD